MRLRYVNPHTVAEALGTLASESGRLLAGGTDFYPSLGSGKPDGLIIDLSRLDELNGIVLAQDTARIGAGTTWTMIAKANLPPCFDGLKAAAREIGSRQIQNRGSIGGNLCNASPAADGVPPLLALGAEVELTSRQGRRSLALGDFILGPRRTALLPGELLTAVIVPLPVPRTVSSFRKLGSRTYLIISIVMVAVTISVDDRGGIVDARIAVGACSPVGLRLPALEGVLKGKSLVPGLGRLIEDQHLAELAPIDDLRATARYRLGAARVLIGRALDDCAARLRS